MSPALSPAGLGPKLGQSSPQSTPSYLGSKSASGAYQAIIALMPPHDTFVDLFVGSGAILTRKPLAAASYAVDLNASMLERLPKIPNLTKARVDARSFLDKFDYAAAGRLLIYADPPYLHSTRSSKKRYAHEMTDADHSELLRQLRAVPANVILSGYPSDFYNEALPGWHTREFQVMTRGGVRTEKLWFNFDPTEAHWHSFAGVDYIDRQRIKRKAERWAANFSALPPGERLAVLNAILSAGTVTTDVASSGHPLQLRLTPARRPQTRLSLVEKGTKSVGIDGTNCDNKKQLKLAGMCNTLQVTSNLRSK